MKKFFTKERSAELAHELEIAKFRSDAGTLLRLYSVFDRKAVTYMPPFIAHNDATASRMLLASGASPDSLLSAHPADFDLYHLGFLNQSTGDLISESSPSFVCNFAPLLHAAMMAQQSQPVAPVKPAAESDAQSAAL